MNQRLARIVIEATKEAARLAPFKTLALAWSGEYDTPHEYESCGVSGDVFGDVFGEHL